MARNLRMLTTLVAGAMLLLPLGAFAHRNDRWNDDRDRYQDRDDRRSDRGWDNCDRDRGRHRRAISIFGRDRYQSEKEWRREQKEREKYRRRMEKEARKYHRDSDYYGYGRRY